MRYVFSEILPWIFGALVLGFLIGWLYWRCRLWLRRRDLEDDEVARLNAHIGDLEAANSRLEGEAAALRGKVDDCAAIRAEAASLRAKVAAVESTTVELDSKPLSRAVKATSLASRPGATKAAPAGTTAKSRATKAAPAGTTAKSRATKAAPSGTKVPAGAAALRATAPATLDLAAAAAALGSKVQLDDLTVVEGIGPKIAALLRDAGIRTWRDLAGADAARLDGVLAEAGPRFRMHDAASWPEQAGLLADGRWEEFKTLMDGLKGGRR